MVDKPSEIEQFKHVLQAQVAKEARFIAVAQDSSTEELREWTENAHFNPLAISRRFNPLESKAAKKIKEEETEQTEQKEDAITEIKHIESVSEQYSRKNPELHQRSLLLLRQRISERDTKEEILKKVLDMFPDYSLADEALDFLLETTEGGLAERVRAAKEEFNAAHGREIKAGKNMSAQAREFSLQGLGTPTSLRNMYREITGNPREATALFEELSSTFTYEKMKTAIDFLLHALGSDLKSKGPSIDQGELHRLFTEARSLQAILGIYRFFKSRMALILSAFQRQGLALPTRLTFDLLAKQFVKYLKERYPSMDKALLLGKQMGISEELAAQIIIYTQLRDAVRQVAPKLFRNDQHRQDVLMSFIEAIEELDDQLEEEEEEEEKEP
jgi:type III secretion protein W